MTQQTDIIPVDAQQKVQETEAFIKTYDGYTIGTSLAYAEAGEDLKAIKGNKIDTYHDTHEAALQWGRQQWTVTIKGD